MSTKDFLRRYMTRDFGKRFEIYDTRDARPVGNCETWPDAQHICDLLNNRDHWLHHNEIKSLFKQALSIYQTSLRYEKEDWRAMSDALDWVDIQLSGDEPILDRPQPVGNGYSRAGR